MVTQVTQNYLTQFFGLNVVFHVAPCLFQLHTAGCKYYEASSAKHV